MTEILLIWLGNHFTYSFYLQTVSFHAQERERERARERKSLATKIERSSKASITEIILQDRRNRPPRSPRSREAPRQLRSRDQRGASRDCSPSSNLENVCVSVFVCVSVVWQLRKCEKMWPDLMIFFLGFVCVSVLRNERYYIFVWQPRKCKQQVENVFSMVFSRTQPNTRKYFPKHFFEMQPNTWKHFPFQKIAFLENRIFSGNTFTRTKRSLKLKTMVIVFSYTQIISHDHNRMCDSLDITTHMWGNISLFLNNFGYTNMLENCLMCKKFSRSSSWFFVVGEEEWAQPNKWEGLGPKLDMSSLS